ncbi:hypothetical protein ACFVIM_20795 [Streptomyces sp. NPDC057638]|uniref:hypothetical protein n=1 Tax=Streptomyces sp. NPDC057638 TaxID=3346190 RepID=UPI0036C89EFC
MTSPILQRAHRDRVLTDREHVIARYRDGVALKTLAREYGVSEAWLKKQLMGWRVAVRGVRAARILRQQGRR